MKTTNNIIAFAFACMVLLPFATAQTTGASYPFSPLGATTTEGANLTSDQVQQLVDLYYEGVRSLDSEQYASAFAQNGTLEDPVGTPPAEGRQAVEERYRPATVLFSEINMYPLDVFAPDFTNEAAVRWRATVKFRDTGIVSDKFFGITYFKYKNNGLIRSARVFWYPTDITINGNNS